MKEPSLKSEFYYLEAKILEENKKHIGNTYTFEWPSFKGKTTFNIAFSASRKAFILALEFVLA